MASSALSSTPASVPSSSSSCSASSSCSSSTSSSPRRLPRVDIHTHILPEHFPDLQKRYGYGDWVRLDHHCPCKARMFKGSAFFREIEENCYRSAPRIKECDELGVTVQCLSTVPVMFSYWAKPEDTLDLCRLLNDHIASICRAHPKRFVGLATIPMQHPEFAIQELKRCMTLGLQGIQIGSHVNDLALSDPSFFPIFEACATLNASIFIHPWDMAGSNLMTKYWLPWLVGMPMETSFAMCSLIFSGVFDKLPNLRVCFAHGGGSFPGTIGRIEHGFEARPDLCAIDIKQTPRSYCGKTFWLDSLVHDPDALRTIVKLVGTKKICLGSDYPFPLGELKPGELIEQMDEFTEEEKLTMLWKSGLEFLGLQDKEDFFLGEEENEEKETNDKSNTINNLKSTSSASSSSPSVTDASSSLSQLSLSDSQRN